MERQVGKIDRADASRLRNVLRNLFNLTMDWVRLYHNERTKAVEKIEELEARIKELESNEQ